MFSEIDKYLVQIQLPDLGMIQPQLGPMVFTSLMSFMTEEGPGPSAV